MSKYENVDKEKVDRLNAVGKQMAELTGGINNSEFKYAMGKLFSQSDMLQILLEVADIIAENRYPELYKASSKRAILKFFQEFTEAGEEVVLGGNGKDEDFECDVCSSQSRCDEYAAFKAATKAAGRIIDGTEMLAEALAPKDLPKEDFFPFSVCLLQDIVEQAGEVQRLK